MSEVQGFKCSLNLGINYFVKSACWSVKMGIGSDTYLTADSIREIGGQGGQYGKG